MKIRIGNTEVKRFKDIISSISKQYQEVNLEFDTVGLKIKTTHRTAVQCLNLEIGRNFFTNYEVDNEKIGVDLKKLAVILRTVSTKNTIDLEREGGYLVLTETDINEIKTENRLKIIENIGDIEYPGDNLKNLDYVTELNIDSDTFFNFTKKCPEDITIHFFPDNLKLSTKHGDNETETSSFINSEVIRRESSKSKYPTDFINYLGTLKKTFKTVNLQYSSDMPCILTLRNPDKIKLEIITAPRILQE